MRSKLKSTRSNSRKTKTYKANQDIKSRSSKLKTSKVSRGVEVKNKTRRFKVAETVTKNGVPVLKRKIKAQTP